MKILNFGSCNIDYTYFLDHIVVPGETTDSTSLQVSCGGKGLNQSVAAAKAGQTVYHAGKIGQDGDILRQILTNSGVDTSYLENCEEKSGHAIIQVANGGQNCIILYPGANYQIDKKFIDDVLCGFRCGDILILQNEISCVPYIVERAYDLGLITVLNPAPFNEKITDINLNKINFLILNEIEAEELTQKKDPDAAIKSLLKKHPRLKIVLTLGAKGAIYSDNSQHIFQPAFSVNAVDTTGAGDTFIGFFISEIAKGKSAECALKTASAASAIAVTKKGAAIAVPTYAEVLNFLK